MSNNVCFPQSAERLPEDYDNYPRLVFELLTGVAEVEDRQASAVIDDILRLAAGSQPNGPAQTRATDAGVAGR